MQWIIFDDLLALHEIQSFPLLGGFALEQINLSIAPKDRLAIIGSTGSGKSTLLKIIAGLTQHEGGTVTFNNEIKLGPNHQLIPGNKGIAYLSQHFELWNNYLMKDVLSYNNQLSNDESEKLFRLCKIDHLMTRDSKQLSGGEKQRIALARLLVGKPAILILDEPFTNLDFQNKKLLKNIIDKASDRYHITCLLCSHDPQDVLPWADTIIVMDRGKIIQQDSPNNIYRYPINDYVAGLLGEFTPMDENLRQTFSFSKELNYLRPDNFKIAKKEGVLIFVTKVEHYGAFYLITFQYKGAILYALSSHPVKENTEVLIEAVS